MAAPESRPQERALPHCTECGHTPTALLWVSTSYSTRLASHQLMYVHMHAQTQLFICTA